MSYIQVKSAESSEDLTVFIANIEYISADPNSPKSNIGLISGKILVVNEEHPKLIKLIKRAKIGIE